MNRERLLENWDSVHDRMTEAARRVGRDPGGLILVSVTKRSPADWIRPLVDFGANDLGENYPQALWSKVETLGDLPVRWHLIGHLQRNKARKTLPMVALIHGVDSLSLLQTLDDLAEGLDNPAGVCLQVNASGEAAKHGWSPEALLKDAEEIAACRRIPVVGLMTMAALDPDPDRARATFAKARLLRDALRDQTGLALPELSMGMSNDFEVAIEEGATLIRVGSALFEGVV
ncbi:MAG: YggS family pyridoxal phosphate-dependent enzyme [Isosphaeraceae bacterium]